jgi:hypothetical protein
MSPSPFSTSSKTARATDPVHAFGASRPRLISVSTGPVSTACTRTPRSAGRARGDRVRDNAAALDTEEDAMGGNGARLSVDRLLTIAPFEASSSGRNGPVTS